jgi:hypothetical protein
VFAGRSDGGDEERSYLKEAAKILGIVLPDFKGKDCCWDGIESDLEGLMIQIRNIVDFD